MAELTIPEACEILQPPIEPTAFQRIITALHIPPVGARHDGKPGRPWPTYPWTELERLHKALMPWLTRGDSETQ